MFKVGKKYKNISTGYIYTCLAVDRESLPDSVAFLRLESNPGTSSHLNSKHLAACEKYYVEYKEPVKVEGWVNVYSIPSLSPTLFNHRQDAENSARMCVAIGERKLIATVFVKGESED